MSHPIDIESYMHIPPFDVPSAIGLGVSVLAAVPNKPAKEIAAAAKRLHGSIKGLQAAWAEQDQMAKPESRRPTDSANDLAWGALHRRLEAYATLPADRYPQATQAQAILGVLFPDGLAFLLLPYTSQWAEGERRLGLVDKQNLGKDIDALAGKDFLAEVRTSHGHYGRALGITEAKGAAPEPVSLAEPLRQLRADLRRYVLKVLSLLDEDDSKSVARVRDALVPIAEFRAAVAERGSGRPVAVPATPATPVPEVPSAAD